jgi:hypothetical protein
LKVLSVVSGRLRPVSFVLALSVVATLGAQSRGSAALPFPPSGSAPAQPAFLRGVLLLHSFEYDDAIASFHEAQRLDPGFALAYWGEAMCFNQTLWFNENLEKARAALARLAPTAPRDRARRRRRGRRATSTPSSVCSATATRPARNRA